MSFLFKRSNAEAATIYLLKYLNVSLNPDKIIEELEKHPDYPSLLAISDVLKAFNIENSAFRADVNQLDELPTPFLANLKSNGGEFAVVTEIDANFVFFADERKKINKLSLEDFNSTYAGVVLIAEPDHEFLKKRKLLISGLNFRPAVLTLGVLLILATLLYQNAFFSNLNWTITILSIIKTSGLIVSLLLLIQSVDSNNPLIHRLCQSGNKTDCNAILSSKAAQVFNGLSWSEVGFFYFSGTWLLLHFGSGTEGILTVLALLNFLSLPYTVYSINYQYRVAKKWCILCCTIQAILWLEFIPFIVNITKTGFHFNFENVELLRLLLVSLLTPIIFWFILKPFFQKMEQLSPLKEQLRKFKYNSGLFNHLLTAQPQFKQPDENWSIVLGNVEASQIITMVSNPYCQPCEKMHQLVTEFIDHNDDVQARIVFTAQNNEADLQTPVTRHLMALNALDDKTLVKNALHDWYEQKQKSYESWAKAYPVNFIESEYYKLDAQKEWCEHAEVSFTPTILLNGYRLPSSYQMTDLKYMLQ